MITSEKFIGVDADLETSLFEYGLLVSAELDNSGEYQCVYSVGNGDFDVSYKTDNDINEVIEETWFEKNSFFDYLGTKEEEWVNTEFVNKLSDLLNYYGYQNFFGDAQYPFDEEQVIEFINKQ